WVCHLGTVTERGPVVIPTPYARRGDTPPVHGSPASRLLRPAAAPPTVCVPDTLVDAAGLARSPFHHSVNYRPVGLFRPAGGLTDPDEKAQALAALVEHIVPGRTADARPATAKEVRGTQVLAVPLDEASLKVRSGGPADDEDDYALP